MTRGKRIYVLDTNVLMHDPTALFRFEEHDVFLPMTVLEELDAAKKGASEVSRNVRQVSRFLDELIENAHVQVARARHRVAPAEGAHSSSAAPRSAASISRRRTSFPTARTRRNTSPTT